MALGPEASALESGEGPAQGWATGWGPGCVLGGDSASVLLSFSLLPSPPQGTEAEALLLAVSVSL